MIWAEHGPFSGIIVDADTMQLHQRLPSRETVVEAMMDLDCFFQRCKCYKEPRSVSCLRYSKVEPKTAKVLDYIENGNGFRAIPRAAWNPIKEK